MITIKENALNKQKEITCNCIQENFKINSLIITLKSKTAVFHFDAPCL